MATLKTNFDETTVPTPPCPKCGLATPRSLNWLREKQEYSCDGCGISIRYDDGKFLVADEQP